jgi:hypothetical protein
MSDRTVLQIFILDLVEKAAAEGTEIDVRSEGIRIATQYPRSGFTIEDVKRRIERVAAQKGVAVSSDLLGQTA